MMFRPRSRQPTHESLRRPLRRARRDDAGPTRRSRRWSRYFAEAAPADAAWAVYFLIGRKPRQVVPTGKLRAWAAEEAGIADWLFEESYDAVGDLAETIALLLPAPRRSSDLALHVWVEERLLPLREADEDVQRAGDAARLARDGRPRSGSSGTS